MLEIVNIEDVYPDVKNPRRDFGDIDALADSFALNDGYPVNPIVVVRDGGIYRIVDGERRYRAMKKLRKQTCPAVVYDSMDDANAAAAMVSTDDKRPLTEEERSRGVQQMLLLGIDPEKVDKAARLGKGTAARLRKARRMVDDAGDDMTLERLAAIAEFDEGDPAVEQLLNCKESEWRSVRDRIVRARERERVAAEMRAAAERRGMEVLETSDGLRDKGFLYRMSALSAADLDKADESWNTCVIENAPWRTMPVAVVYSPKTADETAAEVYEAERERERDEFKAAANKGRERRAAFFADNAPEGAMTLLESAAFDEKLDGLLDTFDALAGADTRRAFGFAVFVRAAYIAHAVGAGELRPWQTSFDPSSAAEFLAWLDAFAADGYEEDEADAFLRAKAEAALDGEGR